jgi:hypothetical protein
MTTTHRFRIETTVNAFHAGQHVHLAPQIFATEDVSLAKFLRRYPGVTYLGSELTEPAPIQAGQFPPCPESPTVINGGFSGGGVQAAKIKKQ